MTEIHKDSANIPASKVFWKRQEAGEVYDRQFKNKVGIYIDDSEMMPLLDLLANLRNARILDVGCGTGRFLPQLEKSNRITGMDLSESMLKQARAKSERSNLASGSAIEIPFASDTFDVVFSVRVIQHIRDQQKMVSEMARVCKPGGRVVLIIYNSWSLLNIYKQIRMSWVGKVLNFPIGWLLKQRSFFGPWGFAYDNYCSIPETKRMMRKAGLEPSTCWGASTGMPWFLQSFFIGKILEKTLPFLLTAFLAWSRFLDRTIARVIPLKYFTDLIMVTGIKKK